MLSLHTNAASLSTQVSLGKTQSALSTSQARLGTGFRVNSAMDDAAGLQIATRMDAQNRGMQVAMRNSQNGISMMQTAEGSFDEVNSMLLRMKDLATQAADGTSSASDKTAMQAEYDQLGLQLSNIMTNTKYNGQQLIVGGTLGTAGGITFQIGADAADTMNIDTSTNTTALDTALGAVSNTYKTPAMALPGTDLTAAGGPTAMITALNTAIDDVGTVRAQLGAAANRLDHTYNNLSNVSTNLTQARGRIMDVDYATETSNMTAKQMLMQAGTSMLKQSNSMSQMVLSLMQ